MALGLQSLVYKVGDGCGGEEPTDTGGVVLMQFEHFLAVTLGK